MSITKEEILKVANLAKLDVTHKVDELSNDLLGVFHLFSAIQSIDTSNIEPLQHPLDVFQRFREDEVLNNEELDLCLNIAPETENGFYLVPQVIE